MYLGLRYFRRNLIINKRSSDVAEHNEIMADKIIKVRIDVTKLNKEYFFKGEKGVYADVTILFNEAQDQYGCNGMVVQDVPKPVRDANKDIKGNILGNCKVFGKEINKEAIPQDFGYSASTNANDNDGVPF